MSYEQIAAIIEGFADAGNPPSPAVQLSWESAQIMRAIGRWETWQRWEQWAYYAYRNNPEGEETFWQRQLNETFVMRELAEQGRTPWDSVRQMLDTRQQLKAAIADARNAGRITEEERDKILMEEQFAGNVRVYCERVLERLNALAAPPVAAPDAPAVADIPVG